MKTALIGHTGFVGSHLCNVFPTASLYNSSNIADARGNSFDLVVISAMPAEKWKANQFPQQDKDNLEILKGHLSQVKTSRVVLISTVDVFEKPEGQTESSVVSISAKHAYGKNRRNLEEFVQEKFQKSWIVRLPALVGHGLKKNVVFDIKNGKSTQSVPINSRFQFYPMDRLGHDLSVVMKSEPGFFHFAVEPLSVLEICEEFKLSEELFAPNSESAVSYDFRTEKSEFWDTQGNYLVDRDESLRAIGSYLNGI
jgi:nucleoside-diphosphate-sugar epimerase